MYYKEIHKECNQILSLVIKEMQIKITKYYFYPLKCQIVKQKPHHHQSSTDGGTAFNQLGRLCF